MRAISIVPTAARAQVRGEALEPEPGRVDLLEVLARQPAHDGAAGRGHRDEALPLELAQPRPDGCGRDPELRCEVALHERRPRRERSVDDQLAERAGNLLLDRLPVLDRGDGWGRPFHAPTVCSMLALNAICYFKSQMTVTARIGVDVGGTFTDVILHEADGSVRVHKLLSTPPSYDEAVVEGGLRAGRRRARERGARGRPRHHRGDERRARAPRRRDGARHDPELPRRARAAAAADPAHVRPLLAQAAAARRAPLSLRGDRARGRRRHGRVRARRGRGAHARRAAARARDRLRRRLLPALVPLPRARAARRRDPGRGAARRDDLPLERDPARAARVRALGDDRRERLRPAADVVVHRPDPDRPRPDRARRRASLDHAVLRWRHDGRRRQGAARCSRSSRGRPPESSRRSGWRSGSGSRTRSRSTWAARPPRRP